MGICTSSVYDHVGQLTKDPCGVTLFLSERQLAEGFQYRISIMRFRNPVPCGLVCYRVVSCHISKLYGTVCNRGDHSARSFPIF